MKPLPYLLICIVLASVLLTAGCLDDLSSTLPPCCDGTCNMTKTSVITTEIHGFPESHYIGYVVDSDEIMYTWDTPSRNDAYDPYDHHNVTFAYEMVDGHRHITGIIEDHDTKECECCQCNTCCQCGGCSQCGTK